jgi:hypothetical protein
MTRYFINVMRLPNWHVDYESKLKLIAIGESKLKFASKLKAGDKIITYVSSRKSCFVGIRTIITGELKLSRQDLGYDEPYFNYIETKAEIILTEEKWIPIKSMLEKLELTKGKKYWMNMFMGAFKEITINDYKLLERRLKLAEK